MRQSLWPQSQSDCLRARELSFHLFWVSDHKHFCFENHYFHTLVLCEYIKARKGKSVVICVSKLQFSCVTGEVQWCVLTQGFSERIEQGVCCDESWCSKMTETPLRLFFIRMGLNSQTTCCFCRILQTSRYLFWHNIPLISKLAGAAELKSVSMCARSRCYVTYVQMVDRCGCVRVCVWGDEWWIQIDRHGHVDSFCPLSMHAQSNNRAMLQILMSKFIHDANVLAFTDFMQRHHCCEPCTVVWMVISTTCSIKLGL